MTNKLAGSTSPYLLQHQNNPVNWFPWSEAAIAKARDEDKPIFLSIGYAACHWCHVMEHESFENQAIADYLNEHFVSIKVDREQRPDLDHIYMQTVQMLTGSGGWPMSVFLTPSMKPFYGGTYWPPVRSMGRPGFGDVLQAIINAWQTNREGVLKQSDEITGHLQRPVATTELSEHDAIRMANSDESDSVLGEGNAILAKADHWLEQAFDERWGGFGRAPKFPHAMDLQLLLRLETRKPDADRLHRVVRTLDGMADGGIYDHLGGGFARYSVDDRWLVPHFEKMLYDNALLASTYLDAYRYTSKERYATVVRETLDYVLDDLTDPLGGFYCTRDADSEGVEGKFYVWTREEILEALGSEQGLVFCEAYGVTFGGNFEDANILHHPEPLEQIAARLKLDMQTLQTQLHANRKTLLDLRSKRIWPGLDDKVLCSWNALMIDAMATAGVVLDEPKYLVAAQNAAQFIRAQMRRQDGRLLHVWRQGLAEIDALLEDYSYLANALLTLFECTGDATHLTWSMELVELMIEYFQDESGGYYFTASDGEQLITRFKDEHDGSVPSGNAMAATCLSRLASITGDSRFERLAVACVEQAKSLMQRSPGASAQMIQALDHLVGPSQQLVFVARDEESRNRAITMSLKRYLPRSITVASFIDSNGKNNLDSTVVGSMIEQRPLHATEPISLYACENHACGAPIHGWQAIEAFLSRD